VSVFLFSPTRATYPDNLILFDFIPHHLIPIRPAYLPQHPSLERH
jgi:hypothetical protein